MVPLAEFIQSTDFQALAQVNLDAGCPADVTPGSICYLRGWMPYGSQVKVRPHAPYVLISNYQDRCVEGDQAERILDDPMLLRWFAVNAVMSHPRLTPIPLGLRSVKPLLKVEPKPKDLLCYANFRVHSPARAEAWRWAQAQPWVTTQPFDKNQMAGFLADVARSHFVLCPEGHGPDTFRLWEVLALGAIPVVCGQRLAPLVDPLPVLCVDAWDELHPSLMRQWAAACEHRTAWGWTWDLVRRDYWQREIQQVAHSVT